MLIRLQYLLLVSLFALLGAAPSAAHRAEKAGTCTTTVSEQQDPCMPSPARFCFATVCNGGEFAGLSESAPGMKTPVRFHGGMRPRAHPDFGAARQVRGDRAQIPAPAVEYYVFSLGRVPLLPFRAICRPPSPRRRLIRMSDTDPSVVLLGKVLLICILRCWWSLSLRP